MIIGTTFGEETFRQRNAVQSWRLAFPDATIVLFGEETEPTSKRLGVWWNPVERYEGIPLLSDIVSKLSGWAAEGKIERVMYINSDIMLAPESSHALAGRLAGSEPFLLTGLRTNTWIEDDVILPAPQTWWDDWRKLGKLMEPCGADWFMFRPGMYADMPPFCVGRTTFDNYLIFAAQQENAEAVDVTPLVLALHQDHEENPDSRTGPLAIRNQELMKSRYPGWTPHMAWVSQMNRVGYGDRKYLSWMAHVATRIQPTWVDHMPETEL